MGENLFLVALPHIYINGNTFHDTLISLTWSYVATAGEFKVSLGSPYSLKFNSGSVGTVKVVVLS